MNSLPTSEETDFPALGFDPAPGKLGAVNDLAEKYGTVGTKLSDANEALAAIVHQEGVWTGSGSEAFARRVGDLPEYLIPAARSMRQAARALEGWHTDLQQMKLRAQELERQAQRAAESAEQARANPDLQLANQTFSDERSLRLAQDLLDNAQSQLQESIDNCEQIQQQAKRLLTQHGELAEQVADALDKARELAPDEPGIIGGALEAIGGLLDDVGNAILDGVHEMWNFVEDHANLIARLSDVVADLSSMIGVASDFMPPFIRQAVGEVSQGLSMAALAGHGVAKLAGGDVPYETLAFDFAGSLPSPRGTDTVTLAGQVIANETITDENVGYDFATLFDDLDNYWVPENTTQGVLTGSFLAGFTPGPAITAFWNAGEEGVAEDNDPERQMELAEDRIWQ